jgi:short-subunit dehydrogenase
MNTNNQCALVTGATSGIGCELTKLFVANNYNLVVVARSQDELDSAVILKLFRKVSLMILQKLQGMDLMH